MVPLLVLAGFASIKGSTVYNGRDFIAKRYASWSSLITPSNSSSQTLLDPPSNSSLQTLHQSVSAHFSYSLSPFW